MAKVEVCLCVEGHARAVFDAIHAKYSGIWVLRDVSPISALIAIELAGRSAVDYRDAGRLRATLSNCLNNTKGGLHSEPLQEVVATHVQNMWPVCSKWPIGNLSSGGELHFWKVKGAVVICIVTAATGVGHVCVRQAGEVSIKPAVSIRDEPD